MTPSGVDVAIVGAHAIAGEACLAKRLEETIFEAASGALEDAGVRRREVDSVVLGASDELDGRSISSMLTAAPAGGLLKDVIKTTDSSLHALVLGAMRIHSGLFDLGLVVSWSRSSEASVEATQRTALEPFIARSIGLIDPIASAVMANAYLYHFGRSQKDLDRHAQGKHQFSEKNSESTPSYVAYPLRSAHIAPFTDCAVAVVLASRSALESARMRRRPVWISGVGWATDAYSPPERTLWAWPALTTAASRARQCASCELAAIDEFEVDDYTALHEVLAVEALGLARPGTGFEYFLDRQRSRTNQHCNGFHGYPLLAAGLWRLASCFRCLVDKGNPRRLLVHGTTGIGGQGHVVVIMAG